ncbi:hypothetical protein SAMN04488038_11368 [Solimonas aquatica]|uniref:Uncharacterized protein n=1 Tax=Solimonas aquatica TaxID=489703 RepID=A0A1H9KED6_9GAMM|nr:hypothetical protein [Solimonas aquatica]SEQ97439.1 hypothetical protein SAMN04488038_11368 [Solimonas aquatica]
MTPYLLLAVGLGLCAYYGLALRQLPRYSEADIAASAELNLHLDQQRTPSLQSEQRDKIVAELREDIARERRELETGLGAGLIALVAALGNFVLVVLLRRASRP